jgi:redox-sensitive bicupin YhaK (pirin superfamily)
MSIKKIEIIVPPREPHFVGDGFRVHNFIPSAFRLDMQRMDPFIMLDYNSRFYFPPSDKPLGVGVHPHRGFETVTIAYKGLVAHHDSAGGGGIIGEGDVQWMTAASGVLHKEYHEETFSKEGGEFQMVQLWVNLPAKYKMSKPKYQAIANQEMGIVELENMGGIVEIIAGEYKGIKGPANTFTPISMLNVKLNSNGEAEFNFPAHFNTALLVVEGEVLVSEDAMVPVNHFILMENKGEEFKIKGLQNSTVLVLSGEPINEPIAAHGPFVMNTRDELVKAFQDFQNGKFGYLED